MTKTEVGKFYVNLVSPILENPKDLHVASRESPSGVVVVVESSSKEQGRLIGAVARTFLSCETLLKGYGARLGLNVHLVIEPSDNTVRQLKPFKENDNWNDRVRENLKRYLIYVVSNITGVACEINSMDITDNGTIFSIDYRLKKTEQEALGVILRAIGKKHGRYIYLEFPK